MKLLELFRRKQEQGADDAWKKYRGILARIDNPKPSDADDLAAIIPVIGPVSEERIRADVATIAQVATFREHLKQLPDAQKRSDAAQKAWTELGTEIASLQKRQKELLPEVETASIELSGLQVYETALANLLEKNSKLFDA